MVWWGGTSITRSMVTSMRCLDRPPHCHKRLSLTHPPAAPAMPIAAAVAASPSAPAAAGDASQVNVAAPLGGRAAACASHQASEVDDGVPGVWDRIGSGCLGRGCDFERGSPV